MCFSQIFCTHLFGGMKDVFFIDFNTSKLLLFRISLSCVGSMLCLPFCIQIFIFVTTHLAQFPQSTFLRFILTDFSFHHHVCFLHMPFSVHPHVFSVPESKSCFNLIGKLSTCSPEVFWVSPVMVSQNFS